MFTPTDKFNENAIHARIQFCPNAQNGILIMTHYRI